MRTKQVLHRRAEEPGVRATAQAGLDLYRHFAIRGDSRSSPSRSCTGRYSLPGWGGPEAAAALDAFKPAGRVLELACGPGMWTEMLLRHATSVTAVDAAPEMLARAKARVNGDRVRFVLADLFSLLEGEASSTIQRRIDDGTTYRAVKVAYQPADLEEQLASLGWRFTVTQTSGPFYWGAGTRSPSR